MLGRFLSVRKRRRVSLIGCFEPTIVMSALGTLAHMPEWLRLARSGHPLALAFWLSLAESGLAAFGRRQTEADIQAGIYKKAAYWAARARRSQKPLAPFSLLYEWRDRSAWLTRGIVSALARWPMPLQALYYPPCRTPRSGHLMNVSKPSSERLGQKARTRQKLLSAARVLVEEGKTLTVARAAERADLAEATAYRYYPNPRSLLRDALLIEWAGLDDLLAQLETLPNPADRAQRAAEEMAQFVLARELSIRLLFAATNQEPRDTSAATGLPQASFRRRLVEAILHGTEQSLGPAFQSIQLTLIVTISPYAVLTLRDAMLLEPADIPQELGRMARRIF